MDSLIVVLAVIGLVVTTSTVLYLSLKIAELKKENSAGTIHIPKRTKAPKQARPPRIIRHSESDEALIEEKRESQKGWE